MSLWLIRPKGHHTPDPRIYVNTTLFSLKIHHGGSFTKFPRRMYVNGKGIIPALQQVFPNAEHRFCLRHVHENMKSKWKGELYKNLLWKCASSTIVPYFEQETKEVLATDQGLYQWLREIPTVHWCRAYFSGRALSDVLLNNLCEVFNRQLVEGMGKPIITCLEYIREYLMKRIVAVHILISKSEGPLTPKITEIFEKIKEKAADMSVQWNSVNKYQVKGSSLEQYVIDMADKTCSCRRWELTGIPCKHVVAVIWDMAAHGITVDAPEEWVSKVYWLETWKDVYANTVDPINGRNMWAPSS
ncbi:putative Zinc finger, SWIM-type [Helianthus debilis subsp. tardiflorus]